MQTNRISLGDFLRVTTGTAALASVLLATPSQAAWHYHLTPYAWATGIGVDAKLDGREVVNKDIPVSDLLEDLDTIFQVKLEASNGTFGAMVDLFDVNLSDEKTGVAIPEVGGTADITSDLGMTILDVAGTYAPQGGRLGLSFSGGTRILDERAAIDANLEPAPGVNVAQAYDTDETLVDALVGIRYTKRFATRWAASSAFDVSTGGTDYTWSLSPTLSYAFGPFGRYGVNAGYRRMKFDFKDDAGMNTQMTLSGALFGFRVSF